MGEKVIGILGGMGPEATLNCFAKILAHTPASKDQDHLRILIDDNPKIPDRTAAILHDGPSPGPAVQESCRALERAGADFIIIPCVTVHYFWDEYAPQSPIPVISLLDVVAGAIKSNHPDFSKVGLMGTDGTVQSGIFQKRLAAEGIETLVCGTGAQKSVMQAIYDLKASPDAAMRQSVTERFAAAAAGLLGAGAQGVIAGCTEIPLGLEQQNVAAPYFDSLDLLARAAIRAAGLEPV